MSIQSTPIADLNDRAQGVFRSLVEAYLESGEPIGSRTLARALSDTLSAATIRNVMQDLEFLGLVESPHISAGRIPTQLGLRMFVDGILEISDLATNERASIENSMQSREPNLTAFLEEAGNMLSGLTQTASIVLAPKTEAAIQHIEFVTLGSDRGLIVLVFADGHVENRIFTPPKGVTPSAMREAANFINAVCVGEKIATIRQKIKSEISQRRQEIDSLAQELIESGVAIWDQFSGEEDQALESRLIVRGRSNLLDDASANDLERIKTLFDDLERKRDLEEILSLTESSEGVKIFIGSENRLFSLSGSSLVVSPYMDSEQKVIGAVGVIGPTRLNYGRVVPIVDYTAQIMGRILAERKKRD